MQEQAVAIGRALARQFFELRGNRSEVHVQEVTLAGLLALAGERTLIAARTGAVIAEPAPAGDRVCQVLEGTSAEYFDELLGQGRR